MLDYLQWLRNTHSNEPLVLVLDAFSVHRDTSVKNKAEQLDIELIFAPINVTPQYQPLDRKNFGPVKMRMRNMYEITRKRKREEQV